MARTLNTVSRGSQTADKQADALLLSQPESNERIMDALRGGRGNMARAVAEFLNERRMGVNEAVGDRLGEMLFTPAGGARVAQRIEQGGQEQMADAVRRHLLETQLAGGAGRSVGLTQ